MNGAMNHESSIVDPKRRPRASGVFHVPVEVYFEQTGSGDFTVFQAERVNEEGLCSVWLKHLGREVVIDVFLPAGGLEESKRR